MAAIQFFDEVNFRAEGSATAPPEVCCDCYILRRIFKAQQCNIKKSQKKIATIKAAILKCIKII